MTSEGSERVSRDNQRLGFVPKVTGPSNSLAGVAGGGREANKKCQAKKCRSRSADGRWWEEGGKAGTRHVQREAQGGRVSVWAARGRGICSPGLKGLGKGGAQGPRRAVRSGCLTYCRAPEGQPGGGGRDVKRSTRL